MMCEANLKTLAGLLYTWSNKKEEEVRERIDRVMVNTDWTKTYPNSVVQNLPIVGLDHSPLLLQQEVNESKAKRTFKFELMWVEEKECAEVVQQNWKTDKQGSYGFKLMRKLRFCSKGLIEWSKKHFTDNMKVIEELMRKIEELQGKSISEADRRQIEEYEKEMELACKREEKFWYQRSRIKWLLWGDKNTRCFHQITIHRRQRNRVTRLKGEDNEWLEEEDQIA